MSILFSWLGIAALIILFIFTVAIIIIAGLAILAYWWIILPVFWIVAQSISDGWTGFWRALIEILLAFILFIIVFIGVPVLIGKIHNRIKEKANHN
ncbi:hypothetical protein [Leuconostoc pseudomesenteroides]|uniref:hypothetical protein n=1 Tax=Leuconostoc pseudomesenteroides TaxID=33968 RepID=UPI0016692537|nr:hypothetical protein [Leuconostoc pseudomesenteroides]